MIFGNSYSKFVSGATTVELPNSILDPDFVLPDLITHQSIMTGKLNYIKKGYYSFFKVMVYLYQRVDPNSDYAELESYRDNQVTFYPHKDGDPIKDIFGNETQFLLSNIESYYLTNTVLKDIALLTFKADRYTQLTPATSLGYGYGYGLDYGDQL